MTHEKRIRIVLAKLGLDIHDRGAKILAAYLRDSGFEVIYTGLYQTISDVVNAAIQEDVDIIGLSILSASHLDIVKDLMEELNKQDLSTLPVICGGTIPSTDVPKLKALNVAEVFRPGTPLAAISEYIRTHIQTESPV